MLYSLNCIFKDATLSPRDYVQTYTHLQKEKQVHSISVLQSYSSNVRLRKSVSVVLPLTKTRLSCIELVLRPPLLGFLGVVTLPGVLQHILHVKLQWPHFRFCLLSSAFSAALITACFPPNYGARRGHTTGTFHY